MTHDELIDFFGIEVWNNMEGAAKHKADLLRRKLVHQKEMRNIIETKVDVLQIRVAILAQLLDNIKFEKLN